MTTTRQEIEKLEVMIERHEYQIKEIEKLIDELVMKEIKETLVFGLI